MVLCRVRVNIDTCTYRKCHVDYLFLLIGGDMFLEKVSFGAVDIDREIVSLLFTNGCDSIKRIATNNGYCPAFGRCCTGQYDI